MRGLQRVFLRPAFAGRAARVSDPVRGDELHPRRDGRLPEVPPAVLRAAPPAGGTRLLDDGRGPDGATAVTIPPATGEVETPRSLAGQKGGVRVVTVTPEGN